MQIKARAPPDRSRLFQLPQACALRRLMAGPQLLLALLLSMASSLVMLESLSEHHC